MVVMYLFAIVAANLLVARFGPAMSVINAFIFVGFDLVARDRLHDSWDGKWLVGKMALLIATGSLLSWVLNKNAQQVAVASLVAFATAATVDAIIYATGVKRGWRWVKRSNASNAAGAAVDSLIFPWVAFGGFSPAITLLQFAAKVGGGVVWSFAIKRWK